MSDNLIAALCCFALAVTAALGLAGYFAGFQSAAWMGVWLGCCAFVAFVLGFISSLRAWIKERK